MQFYLTLAMLNEQISGILDYFQVIFILKSSLAILVYIYYTSEWDRKGEWKIPAQNNLFNQSV